MRGTLSCIVMRLLVAVTFILLTVSLPGLAQNESNPLPTATGGEEPAVAAKLAQIDLPGTDDPELVEIASAVLDDHGMVVPGRRLSCFQWEAYKAALERKVADQPSAFAYWLLATVSQHCMGST